MLERSSSRRNWLVRALSVAAVAALTLPGAGCASLVGVTDTEIDFTVTPGTTNAFFGFTEITIDRDANSASRATLVAVTLDALEPALADLSFMKTLVGEVVLGTTRTLLVTGDTFPRGEQAVALDVKFDGDLRPFFKDGHTIRIEWAGTTNPAFTDWPPAGISVRGRVKVDIE